MVELGEAATLVLKGARGLTKADAKRLLVNFHSLDKIARATKEELEMCPGLGPVRATNLHAFLRTPFSS